MLDELQVHQQLSEAAHGAAYHRRRDTRRRPGYSGGMPRSILTLSALGPAELADLELRAAMSAVGARFAGETRGRVVVLSAEARPYGRLAVEVAAAGMGLSTVHLGVDEVAALGDVGVAARAIGEHAPASILVGWAAARASAYAAASPGPVLAVDGGAGDPVGALADLLTLKAALPLAQHRLVVVGDASARSLDLAVALATRGGSVAFAHPVGFAPDPERLTLVRERAALSGAAVLDTDSLIEGLRDATAVVVEPWPEGQVERFRPFTLQRHQLRVLKTGAGILHRAPERRGPELSATLADDPCWWAAAQRAQAAPAAAALLSSLFQAAARRSVIG